MQPKDLFAPTGSPDWRPYFGQSFPGTKEPVRQAWTKETYAALQQSIERVLPGEAHNDAFERVAILDCLPKDNTLASCDPSAEPPDAVTQWKKMVQDASVDQGAYAKALSAILGGLVCTNDLDLIYVLRGLLNSDRFLQTGREIPTLAKRIKSAECAVSTTLTAFDKDDIDEAVADTLGELICSEEPNRIEVLRELLRSGLILEAGSQMPALADRITSPKCPVAKTLMDEDKRAIATASEKAALLTTSR